MRTADHHELGVNDKAVPMVYDEAKMKMRRVETLTRQD